MSRDDGSVWDRTFISTHPFIQNERVIVERLFVPKVTWKRVGGTLLCAALAVLSACSEKLEGSGGCPLACSGDTSVLQTITLSAVSSDSTVPGGVGLGTEQKILLASRGSTLDTRGIIRFDSLPSEVQQASGSSATGTISFMDSVFLRLRFDSLAASASVPITVEVYDVDTTGAVDDTATATLTPLFTPARLLGSRTFDPGKLVDTVKVPLASAPILAKAQAGQRLRLGVRLSASTSVSARLYSSNTLFGPSLYMRVSSDFGVPAVTLSPYSKTPTTNRTIASNLDDFVLVVIGTPAPPASLLAVGGIPASRAYLRFNVPARIIDSSIVVRATLLLTQVASTSPDPTDTMKVQPYLVIAGPSVTSPVKAAQIISNTLTPMEVFKTFPVSTGQQQLEVAPAFRAWAVQADSILPRAITLVSAQEEGSPQQALFYSVKATNPNVRPQLRVTYTLRTRIGTP